MQEIRISEILELLDKGCTRKQIGEKYNLTLSQVTTMFRNCKLKGKQRNQKSYILIDDSETKIPSGPLKRSSECELTL